MKQKGLDALQSLWDGGQGYKRVWQMETAIEEILGIHAASQEWGTCTLTFTHIIE